MIVRVAAAKTMKSAAKFTMRAIHLPLRLRLCGHVTAPMLLV
jgi:hypothetical protein